MSHTKGKWSIMAGAPWNILCEGGARIVWCRSEDSRNGEPADIANARHIVDLHNASEVAISDIHATCGICGNPVDGAVYVRIEAKFIHKRCFVRGLLAERDVLERERDAARAEAATAWRCEKQAAAERDEARAHEQQMSDNHAEMHGMAMQLLADKNQLVADLAQRDRRIAELEAALVVSWPDSGEADAPVEAGSMCLACNGTTPDEGDDNRGAGDVVHAPGCIVVAAALSPAPAQPATAAKDYYPEGKCKWCERDAKPGNNVCEPCRGNMESMSDPLIRDKAAKNLGVRFLRAAIGRGNPPPFDAAPPSPAAPTLLTATGKPCHCGHPYKAPCEATKKGTPDGQ